MAISDIQICNIALDRIGEKQSIGSLDDNSAQARACKRNYPLARDYLLASHAWRFATTHALLAVLDYSRNGWGFVYAMPLDCVTPLRIWSGLRPGQSVPYSAVTISAFSAGELVFADWVTSPVIEFDTQLSDDGASQVILTDQEEADLAYVSNVTAPGLFPPLFTEALAWKLAVDLALSLPNRRDAAKESMAAFQQAKLEAIADSLRRAKEGLQPASRFITARFRGG